MNADQRWMMLAANHFGAPHSYTLTQAVIGSVILMVLGVAVMVLLIRLWLSRR